ncbi:MAG: serine protease [Polyangiaceae bacterium]
MTASPAIAPVRRAVCALSAGPFRATAWLVSTKALFVTSHSAVGYHVDVELENDAGERRPGRVVAVDVARDLAFVFATDGVPQKPEPMVALPLRETPAVKLGEPVLAVAALTGRGLRIWPGAICSSPRGASPGERFALDVDAAELEPQGGPVVDAEGRAIAILTRDVRGDRSGVRARGTALPAAELRAALRPIEAASDLQRRSPIYRCPACTSPFVPDLDACLACGAALPHPFAADLSRAAADRAVHDALAGAGIIANRVRTGPRTWLLPPRSTPGGDAVAVSVSLDEAGTTAALRVPVASLPKGAREPFYRLLLTLNDQSTGSFRLALDGERVVLLFALHVSALRDQDTSQTLASLLEMAEHYRKILHEGFDAPPLHTLAAPPAW